MRCYVDGLTWNNDHFLLFVLFLFDLLFKFFLDFLEETHFFLLLLAFARQLLAPVSPVTPAKIIP